MPMNDEDIWHTLDIVISDMHTLVYNLTKVQREISRRRHEAVENQGVSAGTE